MEVIRFHGGHQFNIKHGPSAQMSELPPQQFVAASPRGIKNFKPRVVVKIGDQVKCGQEVMHHKRDERIKLTSPAAGRISDIVYGRRRVLQAVVIETSGSDASVSFGDVTTQNSQSIISQLLAAGIWPQLKGFPGFGVVDLKPDVPELNRDALVGIYVSAFWTEPHMPQLDNVLKDNADDFYFGLSVLKRLHPNVHLFTSAKQKGVLDAAKTSIVTCHQMQHKFPAENVGVQLWHTMQIKKGQMVIGLDVETLIDIGHLFQTRKVRNQRTYVLAGQGADTRQHFRGPKGAPFRALPIPKDEDGDEVRFISGGLFTGTRVLPNDYFANNEYALQVLKEDRKRIPFVFFRPGLDKLTLSHAWVAGFFREDEREESTNNNGEERACIQCGYCGDICPVQLVPNLIMKAGVADDIEKMEELAIHDCVECGLCTFVCPSKIELERAITLGKMVIEKEG